jgi:hypothetical protein
LNQDTGHYELRQTLHATRKGETRRLEEIQKSLNKFKNPNNDRNLEPARKLLDMENIWNLVEI